MLELHINATDTYRIGEAGACWRVFTICLGSHGANSMHSCVLTRGEAGGTGKLEVGVCFVFEITDISCINVSCVAN